MNKHLIICFLICTSLACNNYCNGHGKCGSGDKCTCFMGWGGADCSLRSCPYDDAFVDVPLGDINHDGTVSDADATSEWRPNGGITENLSGYVTKTRAHRYAECSNAGICNRETGECECFAGYEGSACQRRGCPVSSDDKVCSGHGVCLTSTTIIHDSSNTGDRYYGWESEKYMSCLCDNGWEGIDCSLRQCPKGVDPVTDGGKEFTYTYSAASFTFSYFQIVYDGVTYQTAPIGAASPECDASTGKIKDTSVLSLYTESVRRILANTVSGFSSATVKVECDTTPNSNNIKMIISLPPTNYNKFKDSTVKVCNDVSCSNPTTFTANNVTATEYLCSRRGICNSETGECECFTGFSGEACQSQRSVAL